MARARRGRGEGTIHQREDGLWVGQVSLGMDAQGRRRRPTVYGATKVEVRAKLLALQQDALTGAPIKPDKLTMDVHLKDWLSAKKASLRSATYESYERLIRCHLLPVFGGLQVRAIDYRRINACYALMDEQGLSKRTVAYVAYLLRSALQDAVAKRIIQENPAKLAARRTHDKQEARCLTPTEMQRFLVAARGERLEDAFIVALHTGLRPGEWLGLTWDSIDWDGAKLTVKQALHDDGSGFYMGQVKTTAGRRTISLSSTALAALKRQHKRQLAEAPRAARKPSRDADAFAAFNLVFTDSTGKPLRRTNIARRDLAPICQRAGLQGVSLHTLRHTHASILIFQGVDPKAIQKRMGHAKIEITLGTYGHLFPGQDERAAERMEDFAATLRSATVWQQ